MTEIPNLESLEYLPYLNDEGIIDPDLERKIGVYAVFDSKKKLQFIGYSRDIYLSLKQHLIRQPEQCYWLKIETITKPSRKILEDIRQAWVTENGDFIIDEDKWNQAIDAKLDMTQADKEEYNKLEELGQIKLLKKIARKKEAEIIKQLENRGVKMEIRFNPKLKEKGLLDLK